MSKTFRLSFEKGINVVGDKAIIGDGFGTIMDNVDLRSGSPRPFKAPEWQFSTPSTTTRSWSYRGRWFHSDNWQDHVGEYIGGIERVYTTEDGKYPTKTIGGVLASLGTARPATTLGVSTGTSLTPTGVSVSVAYDGSGNLPDGIRLYRISAKTSDGIMPPTAPVTIQVTDTNHKGASVSISWGQVPNTDQYNITGYVIFQGDANEQYRLAEVPPSTLNYRDNGSTTAAGDNASQFEQLQPYEYVYSYVRNVNGVMDESGLSTPSQRVTANQGRLITRDFMNDGFMSQVDSSGYALQTSASASCTVSATQYPNITSIGGGNATYNQFTQTTKIPIPNTSIAATAMTLGQSYQILTVGTTDFTLVGAASNTVGLTFVCNGVATGTGTASFIPITGQKYKFSGTTDPLWNGQTIPVVYIDSTHFGVSGLNPPSDSVAVAYPGTGVTLPTSFSMQPVLTLITYTPPAYSPATDLGSTANVFDKDVVYLGLSSGTKFYMATKVSSTQFTVPAIVTTTTVSVMQWIPNNNYYWRWRIYRSEAGVWQMVDELTLDVLTYTDAKAASALGDPPTSYYTDGGQQVDYDKAPLGITGIELHYGMLFGILGHTVRWTPTLYPDAWPETFSLQFGYQPVALASFSQGLIVLCEDAIYRIDGNTPTGLSVSKTLAEDGCFSPHSVQKTDRGLIYLSKRGIMLFDGSRAECLTDTRIPGTTLTAPSRLNTPYYFWWMPTIMTRNYADLAGEEGIKGDQYSFTLDNTRTIEGYNKYIKSFYHLGKYYLFYSGQDYEANTAFVIDLQVPGLPISTMGIKALDAHVDEFENAYVLFDNSALDSLGPPITLY